MSVRPRYRVIWIEHNIVELEALQEEEGWQHTRECPYGQINKLCTCGMPEKPKLDELAENFDDLTNMRKVSMKGYEFVAIARAHYIELYDKAVIKYRAQGSYFDQQIRKEVFGND